MKKILIVSFIFLLFNKSAFSDNKIYFNFDYAVFRGENGKSILEIYYSVNQNSLRYLKTEKGFEAAAKIEIDIFDVKNNKNLFSNIYKSPSVVSDTANASLKQKLVGQINYIIPDGDYKLKIIGSDFNDTTKMDFFEQKLSVSLSNKIEISDLELSTLIEKAKDEKSIFYKNTLEVIPNPSNLFGMNLKDLYYYYEIYGLTDQNISNEYSINYLILNLNNEVVLSQNKKLKKTGEAKAEFGKFSIDSLKRGSYTFRIQLLDSIKNVNLTKEKKFYVFNQSDNNINVSTSSDDFLKSEYVTMSEDAINNEYNKSEYIRSDPETKKFENLKSLDDKRKFMFGFWKLKADNRNTLLNEFKIDYFKRINEAIKLYKEPYKEGWKTDRGRIYIIYGKPDDVERFPFEAGTKSYEVWKYNSVEGGGECIFIEKQPSTGVYWLTHSTFRNELKNENWRDELRQ